MGREFTLVTDHKTLEDLKRIKNPSGRRARWLMTLMQITYKTQYRRGKLMAPADALSRLPRAGAQQPKEEEMEEEHIVAAVTRAQAETAQDWKRQPRKRTRTTTRDYSRPDDRGRGKEINPSCSFH